jgi:hypothetical protein
MTVERCTTALAVLCFVAAVAGAASAGVTREAKVSFACPRDTSRQPVGKIYGANRGTSFCNDGATATATVAGTRLPTFRGGVCFSDSSGFNVGIGTSLQGKRRASDPAGFWLVDVKPGRFVKDSVHLAKRSASWGYTVALKRKGGRLRGSWSGTEPRLVGGQLTRIKASGTFTCKRVLKVPA